MDDTFKYLIHADIAADGVVERSDVVGAVFGQTEGLLGDELDLRELQQSSKVGRIDVQIRSENGQSFGDLTIATSLDRVETAVLAASLETITRVGPCRARLEVSDIEDVRAAKRREVVDRARELLAETFDESVLSSEKLLDEVRQSIRVEDIAEYEGLPAGPRVFDSDAVIVVEGRADVLQLLKYGIKNAVAVEGTNVPDAVSELTRERTVTAFLDGDRGGELILRELAQVGSVDYVAFAPPGRSVEDLDRVEVLNALREKTPYEILSDEPNVRHAVADASEESDYPLTGSPSAGDPAPQTPPDSGTASDSADGPATDTVEVPVESVDDDSNGSAEPRAPDDADGAESDAEGVDGTTDDGTADDDTEDDSADAADGADDGAGDDEESPTRPRTLRRHVEEVIDGESGRARLLDADLEPAGEAPVDRTFDALVEAESPPFAVVLDGEVTQRILDVAAQRGVEHVLARSTGEFVKRPVGPRIRTADQLRAEA